MSDPKLNLKKFIKAADAVAEALRDEMKECGDELCVFCREARPLIAVYDAARGRVGLAPAGDIRARAEKAAKDVYYLAIGLPSCTIAHPEERFADIIEAAFTESPDA